jgi:hypothetical protein
MKKYFLLINTFLIFATAYSQDTIRVGNLVIVKRANDSVREARYTPRKKANVSFTKTRKFNNIDNRTSYFDLDLGFANYIDNSPSADRFPNLYSGSLELNHLKSTNVNLWFAQQRVKLIKNFASLQYGVGLEMFNFRFEQNISFRDDVINKVKFDNINFSKNKLFVNYLTVPVKVNINLTPGSRRPLHASLGMSAGYLLKARNKQISTERGKEKYNGTFNLNNWRIATIGELGFGDFTLYGSYSRTNLFNDEQNAFQLNPIAIGIKLSDL